MRKPTVCISHATGAGGEEVGRAVAERLGLRYVDDEVIGEAAEWAELDPRLVAGVEQRRSFVARLLGHAAERTAPTRLPPGYAVRTPPTDEDLRGLITDVLRSFGAQGGVVIVAHAASFALAGGEVLRVLVTASPGTRAARVAAERGVGAREAERVVKGEDAARADYLRRFYGVEREEPVHFDLVVNTDALEPARAAELVAAAAAAR
ncbi:MAG TPA: cytidylate kinase-like family protein [Gaiellaceae bacterium]|nr:cytidylate kinase-like family protein [Gaiellaceae bacterium]